jgi:hypothetical protein
VSQKFPERLFVGGSKREPQFVEFPAHETLTDAISSVSSRNRVVIAEYALVRVVEAQMVAEIRTEIVQ